MSRTFLVFVALIAAAVVHGQIRFVAYVSGLSQPVAMVQDPGQPNVQYVVQKGGLIRVIVNGTVQTTNFVNLSAIITTNSERGLLGLALPPDYATSGFAYLYYTDLSGNIQIARYMRSTTNPLTLDTSTALKIISQTHPGQSNHNGGTIHFGPDGMLYAALGDGGGGNDPNNNAQNPNTLLGKMIRIDPTSDDFPADPNKFYHIPADNPFVDGLPITAMGEIWDFGLRNPWKWCFDTPALGGTGALLIADVGQDAWEEVDFEHPGTGGFNYGWRQREGAHLTANGGSVAFTPQTDPIFEYSHNGGSRSITGGYVYRGNALGTHWKGRYFFVDEVNGQKWTFKLNQAGAGSASDLVEHTSELGSIGNVVSIDIDSVGELYFSSFNGTIYRLVSTALQADSWFVKFGQLVSGGLPELFEGDDQRAILFQGLNQGRQDSPVTIQLTGTAPAQSASNLRFFLEAQANVADIQQVVEMWDYVANAWVQVDSQQASVAADRRIMITPSSPNRFIEQGTRQIRAQLRYYQTAINSSRWRVSIDQSVWGFYP